MKNKLYILVFIIAIFLLLKIGTLSAQYVKISENIIVAGYVLNEKTLEPIQNVNIYVTQTRRGTITNNSGYFILKAKVNDTIMFSSMGYKNRYTIIKESIEESSDLLIILLEEKIYQLKSVDIMALKKYEQFKYEIINMQLPDDEYVFAIKNFPKIPVDIEYHSRAGISDFGLVFSPITALYNAFSKEGREIRKLKELIEINQKKELFENKISIEKISQITDLTIIEAEIFLEWCNFPIEFILKLSDYDLIILIMNRFEQYKKTHHYKNLNNK